MNWSIFLHSALEQMDLVLAGAHQKMHLMNSSHLSKLKPKAEQLVRI